MAQLLLINSETQNLPYQDIDDIIGVYRDNHSFSDRERIAFDIVEVKGKRADVEKKLREQRPTESIAFRVKGTRTWSLEVPEKWDNIEQTDLWKNPADNKWYFLDESKKFPNTLKDVTSAERTKIKDTDPYTVDSEKDSIYAKTAHDPSEDNKNNVEASDLNLSIG